MKKKFSVFLSNVGACSDRYCAQYAPPFSVRDLFERAASIKGLSGVDLVGTWNISPATANLRGLGVNSRQLTFLG